MPRDLRTYRPRLRSPLISMSRSSSQVSMSDEMPTSVCSARLARRRSRLVNTAVICAVFRKSTSRSQHRPRRRTAVPAAMKLLIGSTTTMRGWKLRDMLVHRRQVHLQARERWAGRRRKRSSPFLIQARRSRPIDAHVADDLALRLLEREVQAALAAAAGGVGEVGGQAGLARPRRAGDQDAAAAVEALAAQHGVEPRDPRRDPLGGRLVVQAQRRDRQHGEAVLVDQERVLVGAVRVPRYLTIRSRRVETWSVTRWSSRITQSETYSSRPCRVSVPSPRSAVMTAVTPCPSASGTAAAARPAGSPDSAARRTASRACPARPAWRRPSRWRSPGG